MFQAPGIASGQAATRDCWYNKDKEQAQGLKGEP
jgi:hypothetical protein